MNIPPLNERETAEWESLTTPMLDACGALHHGAVSFVFRERDELLPATEPTTRKRLFGLRAPRVVQQTGPPRYAMVVVERKLDSRGAVHDAELESRVGSEVIESGRALPQADASLRTLGYLRPDDPENVSESGEYLLGGDCADPNVIRAAVVRSLQAVGLRPQDVTCERLG